MKDKEFKTTCTDETIECNWEPELSSKQEETDTKVFLAAKFAQDFGCRDVEIFTVDSDVAILAWYHSQLLSCWLLLQIGIGFNLQILDIGNNDLEEDLLKTLPSLQELSGCDSVSAINGIGKGKWLKTVTQSDKYIFAIQTLGEDIVVDEITTNIIEKLFCHLYGMPEENEINDARYRKFCKNKIPEPHQLPPTKDELLQHVKKPIVNHSFGKEHCMIIQIFLHLLELVGRWVVMCSKLSGWRICHPQNRSMNWSHMTVAG